MAKVNCKECRGCEKRTPYSTCRETCEVFQAAAEKAQQNEKAERERVEYNLYKSDAIKRMSTRRYNRGRRNK